jgi:hypothetical protein
LAERSGVSEKSIADFERQARVPYDRTVRDLVTAMEAAGVEFILENGGGAGVRLRRSSD